jgi:E3 ubiquitin-protein ligase RGLG
MGNKSSCLRPKKNQNNYIQQHVPAMFVPPKPSAPKRSDETPFQMIPDRFETLEQVQKALEKAGLEGCDLIVGIDFTKSNTWKGKNSFAGKSLHDISDENVMNPYMYAISVIGRTLKPFDDDGLIPVWGFGDSNTKDKGVFPFKGGDNFCYGFDEVYARYRDVLREVKMSGPTSFAPLIRTAIDTVREKKSYHILVILTDGDISEECKKETISEIVRASDFPLSIVTIGLGDGPFELMETFDDELPQRRFDNFNFVNFEFIRKNATNFDAEFSVWALMEIPDQYSLIRQHRLIEKLVN